MPEMSVPMRGNNRVTPAARQWAAGKMSRSPVQNVVVDSFENYLVQPNFRDDQSSDRLTSDEKCGPMTSDCPGASGIHGSPSVDLVPVPPRLILGHCPKRVPAAGEGEHQSARQKKSHSRRVSATHRE